MKLLNCIKCILGFETTCRESNNGLNTSAEMNDIVVKQYKKIIKKINKDLKKSLKHDPVGYAQVEVEIENNTMRQAIMDFYEAQGYIVSRRSYSNWVTITFDKWYQKKEENTYKW